MSRLNQHRTDQTDHPRDVTCFACGAPLSGRDGEFVVKYFLLRHGARRKLRRVHDSDPA